METDDLAVAKRLQDWIKHTNDILSQNNNNSLNDRPSSEQQDYSSLSKSMFELFNSGLSSKLMSEVCQQLITLFRTKKRQLRLLVLEFIPILIWSYLSSVQTSKSKAINGLEACLLTLYNLNLQSEKGTQHITIPSLGKSSVYHEFGNITTSTLTESALSKYDSGERKLPIGPFPQVEKLNAKNRLPMLSHLIRCYTKDIGLLSERSHQSLCALSIKATCTGFKTYLSHRLLPHSSHPTENNLISRSRIVLSPEFLCEILHGMYFVMFNGQPEQGLEVLECIHQRANYELFSNVILLTNAIRNSLEHNPSGQPYDGPMGVSIAITPAHILSSLNQKAITNASFKTQKLPDDITPEHEDGSQSDPDTDQKNASSSADKQSKLLGGITLRPLKSALKRVERSITNKKTVEVKEGTPSPARSDKQDKVDGHVKVSHQPSNGRERTTSEGFEMAAAPPIATEKQSNANSGGFENGVGAAATDSFHTAHHSAIEIVIDPPEEENQDTFM